MKLRSARWSTPKFSVVVATYAREELIIPTLDSVRQQSLQDFEVLVVSDGPPSPVLKDIVRGYGKKFSLLALPERSRSQSGPNNFGWSTAQGEYIAYLGHDDVWHTNHLAYLLDAYTRHPSIDFVVSGCIYFGPPGTDDNYTWITGIFDDEDNQAPFKYFFPPSSFSHRRDLPQNVHRWSDPLVTRRPVDTEFVLGAAEQGCSFMSTRKISVFKFASALRYLSYLCPEDVEQREMLQRMQDPNSLEQFIDERVNASVAVGGYMAPGHAGPTQFLPGEKMKMNEVVRGIALPEATPLFGYVRIGAGDDDRGFDWHAPETHDGKTWRWTGPNHRPRMLLPYCSEHPVDVLVYVAHFATEDIRQSLRIFVNGREVDAWVRRVDDHWEIPFVTKLRRNTPSVVEFRMNRTAFATEIDPNTMDTRRLGLCLIGIDLHA